MQTEKQQSSPSSEAVQGDGRRESGWQGLMSGGLKGGTPGGPSISGETKKVKEGCRDEGGSSRIVVEAFLEEQKRKRRRRELVNSPLEVLFSNINVEDEQGGLDYGSQGSDIGELLDVELERDQCESGRICDVGEGAGEVEHCTENASNASCNDVNHHLSETAVEQENCGVRFLKEIDKDFLCAPRGIVRGEYIGNAGGRDYKLIVRRKVGEGTYVTYDIFNVNTGKQVFLVHGNMSYPYDMSNQTESTRKPGVKLNGGWSWEGYGYGTLDANPISGAFPSDSRDLHVEMWEAVFWDKDEEYHVCGPLCNNVDKVDAVICMEEGCGLRIWSNQFSTFTTLVEEHDLRPPTHGKQEQVQVLYLSLVRFFSGQLKIVLHSDVKLRSVEEEAIWFCPVINRRFSDSLAAIDLRRLETAAKIHRTCVPRSTSTESAAAKVST